MQLKPLSRFFNLKIALRLRFFFLVLRSFLFFAVAKLVRRICCDIFERFFK